MKLWVWSWSDYVDIEWVGSTDIVWHALGIELPGLRNTSTTDHILSEKERKINFYLYQKK